MLAAARARAVLAAARARGAGDTVPAAARVGSCGGRPLCFLMITLTHMVPSDRFWIVEGLDMSV